MPRGESITMPALKAPRNLDDNEARVLDLVDSYAVLTEPHPLLVSHCKSPEVRRLVDATLDHEKFVMGHRSTNLADGELNIYQKAFAILYHKENPIPATSLWIDEILGITHVPIEIQPKVLDAAIASRVGILDELERHELAAESTQHDDHRSDSQASVVVIDPPHEPVNTIKKPDPKLWIAPTFSHREVSLDQAFQNIANTYFKAMDDYRITAPRTVSRTQAAKFVRDTIENCNSYVSDKYGPFYQYPDGRLVNPNLHALELELLQEMKAELPNMADIAVKACGGKKRTFEREPDDLEDNSKPSKASMTCRNLHSDLEAGKPLPRKRSWEPERSEPTNREANAPRLGGYNVTLPGKQFGRGGFAGRRRDSSVSRPNCSKARQPRSDSREGPKYSSRRAMIYNDRIFGDENPDRSKWGRPRLPSSGDCYRPRYR